MKQARREELRPKLQLKLKQKRKRTMGERLEKAPKQELELEQQMRDIERTEPGLLRGLTRLTNSRRQRQTVRGDTSQRPQSANIETAVGLNGLRIWRLQNLLLNQSKALHTQHSPTLSPLCAQVSLNVTGRSISAFKSRLNPPPRTLIMNGMQN